jgi:hypothetical protein
LRKIGDAFDIPASPSPFIVAITTSFVLLYNGPGLRTMRRLEKYRETPKFTMARKVLVPTGQKDTYHSAGNTDSRGEVFSS